MRKQLEIEESIRDAVPGGPSFRAVREMAPIEDVLTSQLLHPDKAS